jgi:hypothetical protein
LPAASAGTAHPEVDYHGLWEMGATPDTTAAPNGGIPGEIAFGIDLADPLPASESKQEQVFSSGFEISAPEAAHPAPQPIASGFEFGFADASPNTQPESASTQVSKPAETISIPFAQTNGASEQTTGFAVPSIFSSSAPDHVLDFKQVEAPEAPAPANEVAFELSSAPATPASEPEPPVEPAATDVKYDGKYDGKSDGKYFDLMPPDSSASSASPAAPSVAQPAEVIENLSSSSTEVSESGFDLAEAVVIAAPAPSHPEEEPLGDVLSHEKEPPVTGQETAFDIAEEAITVDVRPASGESLRMVLPPARESELTGAWAELDSDHKPGASTQVSPTQVSPTQVSPTQASPTQVSPTQVSHDESISGSLMFGGEIPAGSDSSAPTSPERSFDISESGAVISPFDPRELRADEPSEPTVIPPFRNDPPQTPAEDFTSSLLWSEEVREPANFVPAFEPPVQVPAPSHGDIEPGLPAGSTGSVSEPLSDAPSGRALPEAIEAAPHVAEVVESTLPVSEAILASEATPVGEAIPVGEAWPVSATAEPKAQTATVPGLADLAPEAIDEIVRRVVREMSDAVVRELAWEILPDCVERVVEKLSRESLAKKF